MSEIAIDQTNLPRVREVCRGFAVLEDSALAHNLQEQEIEQHYASNIEKSKLVRRDVRVAKRLQDEEEMEAQHYSREEQQQIEELDSQYARVVQEEIQKRVVERQQREAQDKEVARRLQEEEELRNQRGLTPEAEVYGAREEAHRQKGKRQWRGQEVDSLDRKVAELSIGDTCSTNEEQLERDEALARLLQEEEEVRMVQLKSKSQKNQEEDFRTAQVAQDEEIARYIQRQELKAHKQSKGLGRACSDDSNDSSGRCERWSRAGMSRQERLNSEGLPSPGSERSAEKRGPPTEPRQEPLPRSTFSRNIAEELDPTFKPRTAQSPPASLRPTPPALPPSRAEPPDNFYHYPDESAVPVFVAPTRRREERLLQQKSKEKKEGCKQQ